MRRRSAGMSGEPTYAELFEEVQRLRTRVSELERQAGGGEPRAEGQVRAADVPAAFHDRGARIGTRQEEERFRAALKGMPVVAFNQDRDLRYTWVRDQASDDAGSSLIGSSLIGRTDEEAIGAAALEFTALKRAVIHSGVGIRREVSLALPGGRHAYDLTVEPLRDAEGEITGVAGVLIDVTEGRRAQETLRRQEAVIRRLFDANLIGIITADSERILEANDAFLRMVGYSRGDLEAGRLLRAQLTPPEYAPLDRRAAAEMARHGECATYEKEYVRKDGARVPILIGAAMISRDPPAGVGFVADISAQKRAEAALRESEARFRGIVELSPVGVLIAGRDTRIREANPALCRMLGYAVEELTRLALGDILVPGERDDAWSYWQTMAAGHATEIRTEKRLLRKSGEALWTNLTVAAIRDAEGRPVDCIGFIEDVDERKRIAEELRENMERLALAMDAARIGTWDFDLRTGMIRQSARRREIMGLPAVSIVETRKEWVAHVHPEDRAAVNQALRRAIEEGGEYDARFRVMWPDGSVHWNLGKGTLLRDAAGRPVRMIGVGMDVTAEVESEAVLRRAKEAAEQANLSKTHFLAAASHDLRQPLQAIGMTISMLLSRHRGDRDAALLERADRAVTNLADLLNALMDVSQLDAGLVAPQISDFPLAALLQGVREEFEPAAASKGVVFVVVSCLEIGRSDPALLGRMLRNLTSNAVKYTPGGGRVTVSCRRDGAAVDIVVADTGIGIPKEQQDLIFEEFRQLHNPERDRTKGFGLGLAIVARMSQLLDHPVTVSSMLGQGSTFTITVPLGTEAAAATEPAGLAPTGCGRVLLVEDDALVFDALNETLAQCGFDVTGAASAEAAIEIVARADRPFDVVVADYRLPSMSGLEVVAQVRRRFPAAALVILTGDAHDARLDAAKAQGVTVLQKPVQLSALVEAIGGIDPTEDPAPPGDPF